MFKRRNKYFAQDLHAMRMAARYGLTNEYKTARRHGRSPQEALEEWDLVELKKKNN